MRLAGGGAASVLLLAGAGLASAQTTTGTSTDTGGNGTTTGTTTPGVPNTGAGDSAGLLALATTGLLAIGAGAYLLRGRYLLQ